MMGHPHPHWFASGPTVADGFVKSVSAKPAELLHPGQVFKRCRRIYPGREVTRVRRNDQLARILLSIASSGTPNAA